jgi:hypothetical protein
MKCSLNSLALVEALPCSKEVRGSEAYKRKTGRNSIFCTDLALQSYALSTIDSRAGLA